MLLLDHKTDLNLKSVLDEVIKMSRYRHGGIHKNKKIIHILKIKSHV